jgi:protein-tyrosine phosphatase
LVPQEQFRTEVCKVRIEVVCYANVCRSPVAAELLREGCRSNVEVRSSGLFAQEGAHVDPVMLSRLGDRFPRLRAHSSHRTSAVALSEVDLVLVMERSHKAFLSVSAPYLAGRIMLFGAWRAGQEEIADPIGLDDRAYDRALAALEDSAAAWCNKLHIFK